MSESRVGMAGFQIGSSLAPVGRAQRFLCTKACDNEPRFEVWRLPSGAEAIAKRLLDLGERGVGGFVVGGADEEGLWLIRRAPSPLSLWLGEHSKPVDSKTAIAMIASLADSLGVCERAALFPGVLLPSTVDILDTGDCEIRADELVHGLLGASPATPSASPRWKSPECIDGEGASFGGNRYVLGLFLYRLLCGEHPFSGRGMRLALADRAERGASPFSASIQSALPPGLQSYCLRILSPDSSERPKSANAIASRLRKFHNKPKPAAVAVSKTPSGRRPKVDTPQEKPAATPLQRRRNPRLALIAASALVGVVAAGFAIAKVGPDATSGAKVQPREPLTEALSVADCTTCHPRQTSEWERSVMAHSAKSPLFQSLEMVIQEQVGKSRTCPEGAGILRTVDESTACRNPATGHAITGSGGELWCANCHSPGENLRKSLPAWNGISPSSASRLPLKDLLPDSSMEGIGCGFCHQVTGPVKPGNQRAGIYEGNPSWTSFVTGREFSMRPEDRTELFGIANSGYLLNPLRFLAGDAEASELVPGGAHRRPSAETKAYLRSSEFCGSCHDVRLFGSDVIGAERGENFKRLRNAYSEWQAWSRQETRQGRVPATCQDCHMSTYPGICEVSGENDSSGVCPDGTAFSPRAPGEYATASTSAASIAERVTNHYFSGVDVPLSKVFPITALDDPSLDSSGIPLGARQRRDLLLSNTFDLKIDRPTVRGQTLEIPVVFENVGAGHRVPAGFSQEREVWIHLRVTDGEGKLVYEVGRVGRGDEDLADKVFLNVNTSDEVTDRLGQPLGLFGADIIDGPDVPEWTSVGGSATEFRGIGLVNLQNGFLRCVRCIGRIDDDGRCQAGPGQSVHRAARYADGDYDIDTGECRSNLRGDDALFEIFFPVGALDASRGVLRGPDAIVDSRSAPPGVPIRYSYEISRENTEGPYRIEARMMFRAFPPFLLRAFAEYEREQDRKGRRPSGPLLGLETLERLEAIEIAKTEATIP